MCWGKSIMNMRAAIFLFSASHKGGNFLSLTDVLSGFGAAVVSRLLAGKLKA